jgi:hypothetical protein
VWAGAEDLPEVGDDDGEEDGRRSRLATGRRGSGAGRRLGGGRESEQAGDGEEGETAARWIRRWKRRSMGGGDLRIWRVGLGIPAWSGAATSRPQDSGAVGRGRPAVAAVPAVADELRRRL